MSVTVLTPPRPPLVDAALDLARGWCAGQVIDGAPALAHAAAVAVTVGRFASDDATPELVAACLLHDAPVYAPYDVDLVVGRRLGPAVLDLVQSLEATHRSMASWRTGPQAALDHLAMLVNDRPVIVASAADKLVAFHSVLRRADHAPDPAAYWEERSAFLAHVGYFRAFGRVAVRTLPAPMATHFGVLIERVMARARTRT